MKIYIIYVLVFIGLFNEGCEKDSSDNIDIENVKVEQFILSLKQGTYTSGFLPDFTPNDISALLEHACDYSEIVYFPSSYICSYAPKGFNLGKCILWNIESIRINYPDNMDKYRQFPSCIPMLIHNDYLIDSKVNSVAPVDYRLDNTQLDVAYKAYKNWWAKSRKNDFDKIKTIIPLKDLDFMWY